MKLTFFLIFLVCLVLGVFLHEETHKMIFKVYNCTDIRYSFSLNGIYVKANCLDKSVKLPTALNEIGYPLIPFFALISAYLIDKS